MLLDLGGGVVFTDGADQVFQQIVLLPGVIG